MLCVRAKVVAGPKQRAGDSRRGREGALVPMRGAWWGAQVRARCVPLREVAASVGPGVAEGWLRGLERCAAMNQASGRGGTCIGRSGEGGRAWGRRRRHAQRVARLGAVSRRLSPVPALRVQVVCGVLIARLADADAPKVSSSRCGGLEGHPHEAT